MTSIHPSKCLLALAATILIAAGCEARSLQGDGAEVQSISPKHLGWLPDPCSKFPLPSKYYGQRFQPGSPRWCHGHPQPATCPVGSASIGYVNLLRSNDTYGSGTFGMMKDVNGQDVWRVLPHAASAALASVPADAGGYSLPASSGYGKFKSYSNAPDIPTLHLRGNDIFMVNHFEYNQPGSMYISKLSQDLTGQLTVKDTEAIKDGPGTWFPCSGTVTPWDSHLGSEEYPADCRIYEDTIASPTCKAAADFTACGWTTASSSDAGSGLSMARHVGGWGLHPIGEDDVVDKTNAAIINLEKALGFGNQAKINEFTSKFNCYEYGGSPEVTVGFNGAYQYRKWRTLGRVSHESAIVMPDLKTVYTTDDGTNCGFFMFKADRKADLSSGRLYAAKLTQQGAADNFGVSWIYLGRATQYELERLIASKPRFSDMFETAAPVSGTPNSCPAGFKAVNTPNSRYLFPQTPAPGQTQAYIECLRVKPGMEKAAAFLETRRYAATLGATTEFEKEEGITYDPVANQLYVAYTQITNGMVSDPKYSAGQAGDINMPENRCGTIFTYPLDRQYTANHAKAILYGKPLAAPDGDGNKCSLDGISNPDNVHYINGILLIAEDSGSHVNNVLWAYDIASAQLTRILSSPRTAEVTGIYISYANDYAYLALAMQHPVQDTPIANITLPIAQAQRSYVGYIGPLSAGCLKAGKKPVFAGIPAAKTTEEKNSVLATTSVQYR